ncbi:MAG TPA: AAA family ATPase [Chitinispirillaceae bacterium]|nr:AAA family ATPase [Chitinispirillaceae bacterium]
MGYLEHWNLKEKPFEELCDIRFFFESDDHREALDRLLYLIKDRNMCMGLLTGEVGSGKTITKNVLINSLPSHNFEVINFDYCNFTFNDLLFEILQRITFKDARLALVEEMETPSRNDKYQLFQLFKKKLEILLYEEKRHLVLIFDEAQQLEDVVLDELKNLTNNFSRTENFLTIFFVGQPELREKIRRLKQVDQRIFLRFHLNNLDYNDTLRYIQHRLRVAGLQKSTLFTSLGQEIIFRNTGGVPREINRLCKLALNYGFAQNLNEISREDIQVIIDDLQEHC